jgi:hypothetical protein
LVLEQRINITFCVKLGNNASDTCVILSEAYEGEAIRKSSTSEWHKWFKEDHENVEDDEGSGHPRSTRMDENVDKVWNILYSDRRLSIRTMVVQLHLDKETVRQI